MHVYFSSETPVAVKINGSFWGIVNDSVKGYKSNKPTDDLIEVLYLNGEPPFAFLLDANIKDHLSENIILTDLGDGLAFKFLAPLKKRKFKNLDQAEQKGVFVSTFAETGTIVAVKSPFAEFSEKFEFNARSAKIDFPLSEILSYQIVLVSLSFETDKGIFLCVLECGKSIKKIFGDYVNSFKFENEFLITELVFNDIKKHRLTTRLKYEKSAFVVTDKTLTARKEISSRTLPTEIIPYAFFEELLLDGDITPFAIPSIADRKNTLYKYLGNFIGCMPPPPCHTSNDVGLVYRESHNVYIVKYVTVTIENKKITNLKLN